MGRRHKDIESVRTLRRLERRRKKKRGLFPSEGRGFSDVRESVHKMRKEYQDWMRRVTRECIAS